MAFSISVRLRHGRYDAGGERSSTAEWPPHPARVFCALAASAESDADWAALRWLESQLPPQVRADSVDDIQTGRVTGYVVENTVKRGGGNLTWPGRSNGVRSRSFTVPVTPSFVIIWPEANPPHLVLERLHRLADKVPYVGRSTSVAVVSISCDVAAAGDQLIYRPTHLGNAGDVWELRIPYPGYTDQLQAAYRDGRRSWEVAKTAPYTVSPVAVAGATGTRARPAPVRGPFAGMMTWSIARPSVPFSGDQVVALACALRGAILSRLGDSIPAQVSGHDAPGRPHVGFLAIPDVGHQHADGHIMALALAIPRDLEQPHLAALLGAVITNPLSELDLPNGRILCLKYGADRWGIQPSRWAADGRRDNADGATDWATVTPLMLDGHLRRGRDSAGEVARSLELAGYPRPEVEVSLAALVPGGINRPQRGSLPSGRPRRPLVHARVRFPVPVIGPVLAGSMRYLGLGLFLPVGDQQVGTRSGVGSGEYVGTSVTTSLAEPKQ
jgi:CRISPR-associated protein Csb2